VYAVEKSSSVGEECGQGLSMGEEFVEFIVSALRTQPHSQG